MDIRDNLLAEMDVVVASLHRSCYNPGTLEENTQAYLKAMENPWVNIIGHPDDISFPVDFKALVKGAREHNVLLEINNWSLFNPSNANRYEHSEENYRTMLDYCRQYETLIIIDSDAHHSAHVRNHSKAWKIIEDMNFPEELIANSNPDILKQYLNYYKPTDQGLEVMKNYTYVG